MVDQTSEVSNTQQMNEYLFKEFLSKNPVWDFDNISREKYIAKSNSEKEYLTVIIKMKWSRVRVQFALFSCLFSI